MDLFIHERKGTRLAGMVVRGVMVELDDLRGFFQHNNDMIAYKHLLLLHVYLFFQVQHEK